MLQRVPSNLLSPAAIFAAAAWAFLIIADLTGVSAAAGHHALIERFGVSGLSTMIFSLFWLMMVVAMMIPLNHALIDAGFLTAQGRALGLLSGFLFIIGYAATWLALGVMSFLLDAALHSLSHTWLLLRQNEWLVMALLLALTGAYQFLPTKVHASRRCQQLSHPANRQAQGATQSLKYGAVFGRHEILSCGNLMILAIAIGHSSGLMLAATVVILTEKAFPRRVTPLLGWALLSSAALVCLLNAWR